jgi:uncharacterized protein
MSDPVMTIPTNSLSSIKPLTMIERRILGVLIEKQKTSKSADAYPMTLNSLTLGCNQKSNRDPVLELSDEDVEETIAMLGRVGFTMKMTGGRADRYRHLLYDVWKTSKIELAILAELLMRGPQTFGELRTRASRMEDIADLDSLTLILKSLAERKFVVFLSDPERRGAMVTHGFHLPEEMPAIYSHVAGQATSISNDAGMPRVTKTLSPGTSGMEERFHAMEATIQELKDQVLKLQADVMNLKSTQEQVSSP